MDQKNINMMFDLIKSAVFNELLPVEKKRELADEDLKEILSESKKQDSLHLVAHGLHINGMLAPDSPYFAKAQQIQATAMYRNETQRYVFEQLCNFFEEEKIDFMPLKGSVIRKHYREGWLRTSCDIDILVKEYALDRCGSILAEKYGYTYEGKCPHNVSFFTPEKIHFELHYNLVGNRVTEKSREVADGVWKGAKLKDGYNHWYEMSDEMFYYYHIAHIAKHFLTGGCGIKPFIDMLILEDIAGSDIEKRNKLLEEAELLKFANNIRKLYRVWFLGEEHTETTFQMQEYILNGGVYGTSQNKIVFAQQRKGGKFKYVISLIFLPYSSMKKKYPILEKHKYLLPIYTVRRWIGVLQNKKYKKYMSELEVSQSVSSEKVSKLSELGL